MSSQYNIAARGEVQPSGDTWISRADKERGALIAAFCEAYEAREKHVSTYLNLAGGDEEEGPWHDEMGLHESAVAAAWGELQEHINKNAQ